MELVSDKQYQNYARVTTFVALLLFVAASINVYMPDLAPQLNNAGLSYFTIAISGVHLLYFLFGHKKLHVSSPWIAAFVTCLLLALNLYNLMHVTGEIRSWWHLGWVALNIANGLFGTFIMVCSVFLTSFYYVIINTHQNSGAFTADWTDILVVIAVYASSYIGHIVWKNKYKDHETQAVSRLTGIVKTKQSESEVLLQSIGDGVIVVDMENKVKMLNSAAATMTGWPVNESANLAVSSILKLIPEDSKDAANTPGTDLFSSVLKDGQRVDKVMQLVSRKNELRIVSVVISPVLSTDKQVTGAIAVMRDISNARAEEQRRADFISTASHEMRTPVAAIEGYLALALNDKVSQIDTNARSYLEKAHSSTQHLGKLFQDLLTSAKAEDGRLVNHPTVVEMSSLMEQVADSLRFTAEKKGLVMEFTVGAGQDEPSPAGKVIKPLYYVHVDPDRLREVVTNLFDNAVKYTESGKISIGLTGNHDVVQMYIQDTGPGIPAQDVPHLFQKFYRVDNSATRTIGGTGLGLFICRKIIDLYKGQIWVESQEGKGSTFYINLPRLDSKRASDMQTAEAAQQTLST